MLRRLRKVAVWTALGISLLAAAGAGATLGSFLLSPPSSPGLQDLEIHSWWFSYRDATGTGASPAAASPWIFGAYSICALLAALAGARANAHAERGGSPVALFFSVAFFTLCLEGLRAPAALLFLRGHSISAGVVLTRVVYGGRFAGELALLAAGLHALEMTYRRDIVILGTLVAISLGIAIYVPIDRTAFLSSLLFKLGDEQGVWFAELALAVLIIGSLAAAASIRRSGWVGVLAVSSALLLAGRQILSFSGSPGRLAAGLALLCAGAAAALIALGRQTRTGELEKEPEAESG
jgi:hypothetical protein